ncbi:MAG: flagellar export chaperone FliS [Treponema sp.]|nr:flagellar export chaperone FliS [Treponema sp.]MCL2250719.1 flagellar export chaperone FliS [Treponema sp.]
MAYKDASLSYKETKIKTAGPAQLVVMLYDEAVKQLTKAIELLEADKEKKDPGRIELISKAIMKTEEIITELMISLDFEQGGEIAKQLFSLYTWFNRELLEASIAQDKDKMITVKQLISELRNTWDSISQNAVEQPNREAIGINIAG